MTERELRILDRQMNRLLRCLEAEDKAEIARRKYWRTRGGLKAQVMAEYEEQRRKRLEEKRSEHDPHEDEPKR
jgi:hypothetical protein